MAVPDTTPSCPALETARASDQLETPAPIPPWIILGSDSRFMRQYSSWAAVLAADPASWPEHSIRSSQAVWYPPGGPQQGRRSPHGTDSPPSEPDFRAWALRTTYGVGQIRCSALLLTGGDNPRVRRQKRRRQPACRCSPPRGLSPNRSITRAPWRRRRSPSAPW